MTVLELFKSVKKVPTPSYTPSVPHGKDTPITPPDAKAGAPDQEPATYGSEEAPRVNLIDLLQQRKQQIEGALNAPEQGGVGEAAPMQPMQGGPQPMPMPNLQPIGPATPAPTAGMPNQVGTFGVKSETQASGPAPQSPDTQGAAAPSMVQQMETAFSSPGSGVQVPYPSAAPLGDFRPPVGPYAVPADRSLMTQRPSGIAGTPQILNYTHPELGMPAPQPGQTTVPGAGPQGMGGNMVEMLRRLRNRVPGMGGGQPGPMGGGR